MRHYQRVLSVVLFIVVAVAPFQGCANKPAAQSAGSGTITIGVDLPLNGADASDGVPTANAIKLAVKDANDGQLVAHFTLAVDVRDDTVQGVHNPDRGATNFRAFLADPTDLGVIGPLNSNVAQALIPMSNANRLALISPSNTNPGLTKGNEGLTLRKDHPLEISYFRTCTTDDNQGSVGAIFAYAVLKARRAYIMDDNQTFGKGIADQWATQFRSEGGTILGHDHARLGQTDFRDLVDRAAAAGPDIVFFGGDSSTGGAVARKQMAGTPLARVYYESGDGILNQQFLNVTGPEAVNSYATVASVDAAALPTAASFVKEYRAAYGQDVGSYSANAYVATMVLVQAIGTAVQANDGQMPTRAQVLEQLRGLSNFNSILGVFSFDQNGDTTLKIVSVWQAKNNRWVFLTQKNYKS